MPLKFVSSTRGKPLLVLEGYTFRRDRSSGSKTSWRCTNEACKARVFTEGNEHEVSCYLSRLLSFLHLESVLTCVISFQEAPEHTHASDRLKLAVRVKLNMLKSAARRSPKELPSSVLVSDLVGKVKTQAVRGRLPNLTLLKKQVNYARRRQDLEPAREATTRNSLQIPESLKVSYYSLLPCSYRMATTIIRPCSL